MCGLIVAQSGLFFCSSSGQAAGPFLAGEDRKMKLKFGRGRLPTLSPKGDLEGASKSPFGDFGEFVGHLGDFGDFSLGYPVWPLFGSTLGKVHGEQKRLIV